MCQFKSAIVVVDEQQKGGFRLLLSAWTESHSEIATIHRLSDDGRLRFARVEYSPKSMETAHLVEGYALKIDEDRTPEWFSAEMKEQVADKLRSYVSGMIVTGKVELLIGGQFIIAPGAEVNCAKEMIINVMCGGTLNDMRGGVLDTMWGATLNNMYGGTVNNMWSATLNNMYGGTLKSMHCGTLKDMRSGTLDTMWGGTLNHMHGGTLNHMWGATLNNMYGGTVNNMHKDARLTIHPLFGGVLGKIGPTAKIINDER